MSNYRRLISYIYAYEGGVKGKNIGYAKIEIRGDQCRIQVNVKKVYVGSNDIGVYLLSPGAEIMLGKIFIRGGAGEFRVSVHSGNVEGSGYSMDQCYGLTVHDVESTWQCYTTIWDDAVTQAAELGDEKAGTGGSGNDAGDAGDVRDGRDAKAVGRGVGAADGGAGTGGDAEAGGAAGNSGFMSADGSAGGGGASAGGTADAVGGGASAGGSAGSTVGGAVVAGGGTAGVVGGATGVGGGAAGVGGGTGSAVGGAAGAVGGAAGAVAGAGSAVSGAVRNAGNMEDAGSNTNNTSNTSNTSAPSSTGKLPIQRGISDVTDKAAEFVLADVTSENVRAKEVPAKIPVEPEEGADLSARFPVSAEIEKELSEEEARLANVAPWEQEEEVAKEEVIDVWLPEPAEETLRDSMEKSAERMVEASAGMKDYIGELADSVVEESMEGLQESMTETSSPERAFPEAASSGMDFPEAASPEAIFPEAASPEFASPEADGDEVAAEAIAGAVLEPSTPESPIAGQKPDTPISGARSMQEAVQQALQVLMGSIMTGPEKPATREEAEPKPVDDAKTASKEDKPTAPTDSKPVQNTAGESGRGKAAVQIRPASLPPEPGDPAQLEALDRMEKEAASQNHLWNQLGRRYPRVLAFDYENGCEILSIKPQDIGLLPREVWVYGNNSFLLHGYYNYRHLILAKLNNPKGRPRYLLGVPGHYFSNEKYMASMFGFPNFVLAKRQPEADGRYGYWYTDIRL